MDRWYGRKEGFVRHDAVAVDQRARVVQQVAAGLGLVYLTLVSGFKTVAKTQRSSLWLGAATDLHSVSAFNRRAVVHGGLRLSTLSLLNEFCRHSLRARRRSCRHRAFCFAGCVI